METYTTVQMADGASHLSRETLEEDGEGYGERLPEDSLQPHKADALFLELRFTLIQIQNQ